MWYNIVKEYIVLYKQITYKIVWYDILSNQNKNKRRAERGRISAINDSSLSPYLPIREGE